MGDEVLEQRKENVKKFLNKLKLNNENLIYLGIYLLLFILIYLKFGDSFRLGKSFVFIKTTFWSHTGHCAKI